MIWLLNIIPHFMIHLVLIFGVLGLIISFIPYFNKIFNPYSTVIKLVSLCCIVFGVYFEGVIAHQKKVEQQIKELQITILELSNKSAKENTKIVEKVVTVEKIIKLRGDTITKYIDKEIVKYDSECKIPEEFIIAHNKSAERP